jgi:hypothetical protein
MALEREFVKTLNDWITWYNYHKRSAANASVERKLEFQQKAINGLFFVVAAMADEMARIDGGSAKDDRPALMVPVGVHW